MNRQYAQTAPAEQARLADGALTSPAAAARVFPTANPEQALFRVDLRRALQLHRGLALAVFVAGATLAVVYFLSLWPVYIAQSLVYVQPAAPKVLDQGGPARWPYDGGTYESYIQQQMQNVTRIDVLTNALHKLDPGSWQSSGESDQAAADRLKHAVEVERQGATYQFFIGARAKSPEVAAQLANAVTTSYIESASKEQKSGDTQRLTILREERDRVQKELTADRAEQDSLNKQLGVAAVGVTAPDLIDEDIGRTRGELVRARTDHDVAAARFTSMNASQGVNSTSIAAEADDLVAADPGLNSMKTSLNQRRAALLTQMANLTPNHPEYKQDAEELAKINGTLDSMMKDLRTKAATRIQERLRTDLERTAGVEEKLNGQLRQLVGTASGATPKLQRSSDLAADITRLQARYSTVDEQMHNLMLEVGGPGAVFLTTAAVPPLQPAKSGVIRNAIVLLFASMLFGILAAVAAHKMDPRVYIGSDVEQILGFAPMAMLPDFGEVSDEVAEEHLLRLSAAIEHARKLDGLKSCIFTGTAAGAGVTTVVTRVRDMLEAMGKATVLVDATGAPTPAMRAGPTGLGLPETASQTTQRGTRSTALLQQVAEESEMQRESLVLTDTAPLSVSAETEYMARFVDCAIVIIESGVTTRAQLRAAANTLQRLDVRSVGFVLNRVGLAKADPAFRHSVQDAEKHLRSQSRSPSRRTVRSRHFAASASAGAEQSFVTAGAQPEPPAPQFAAEPMARRSSAPISELPSPAEGAGTYAPTSAQQGQESPWWLADPQSRAEAAYAAMIGRKDTAPKYEEAAAQDFGATREFRPQTPPLQQWERPSSGRSDFAPQAAQSEARQPEPDDNEQSEGTRLSGLRSMLFSMGLKNLNKTRDTAAPAEELFSPYQDRQGRPVYAQSFGPFEPIPVAAVPAANVPSSGSTKKVVAQPEFLPPREFTPATSKDAPWDTDPTARRDRRDSYDEVQILPSWRGQYRKKD